jgi:hypothetical protein
MCLDMCVLQLEWSAAGYAEGPVSWMFACCWSLAVSTICATFLMPSPTPSHYTPSCPLPPLPPLNPPSPEFRYPAAWLGDQTLAARTAAREEAARGLLAPLPSLSRAPRRRSLVEPTAAFGPAGST